MKYYIPTTSMNFNCILSSESISPVGFYQARGFGYSRWFTIPLNDQEGAILLYDRPFCFKRPDSDQEDHPMMIEIDSEEEFLKVGDGVYACDHTIYLNSMGDKIVLFSEQDKATVLSLSDSSLETKMVRFFKKRILVRSFEGDAPDISRIPRIPMNHAEVERDQKINKIKGLLYGYYIGALLSADPKDVKSLNVFREMQSIFSAVISSEYRRPTAVQSHRLAELFAVLQRDDPFFAELVGIVGDESKAVSVVALARRYGHVLSSIDEDRLIRDLANIADENPSQKWVKSRIDAVGRAMMTKRQKLAVGNDEIVTEAGVLLKLSDAVLPSREDNLLFVSWVNDVLSQTKFNGKISTIKEPLSDELTVKAKAVLGEAWQDGNVIKTYMNDLRRHVRGASFDHSWDNGLLSSIAAVVTKGDNWDKLLIFMQSNGMTDYRLAFAFYGMLNGFANLTRDFTDILLGLDPAYLIEVYCEFYGELHGRAIRPAEHDPERYVEAAKSVSESKQDSPVVQDKVRSSVFQKIIGYFKGLKVPTKNGVSKESLLNALTLAMDELDDAPDPNKLLELLVKKYAVPYGWKKTNKPWKSLKEFVKGLKSETNPMLPGIDLQGKQEQAPLAKRDAPMRENALWIKECARMIDDEKARRCFCEDVKWFLEKIESGKDSGTAEFDKSNSALISRFERYLAYCVNPTKDTVQWKADVYRRIPVDKIVEYLKVTYA